MKNFFSFCKTILAAVVFLIAAYMPVAALDGTMQLNTPATGVISAENVSDEWTLELAQDQTVVITLAPDDMNTNNLTRANIALYDGSRVEIFDNPVEAIPFSIAQELTSGTYYIQITGYDPADVGGYSISAQSQDSQGLAETDAQEEATAAPESEDLPQTGLYGIVRILLAALAFGAVMIVAGLILMKKKKYVA